MTTSVNVALSADFVGTEDRDASTVQATATLEQRPENSQEHIHTQSIPFKDMEPRSERQCCPSRCNETSIDLIVASLSTLLHNKSSGQADVYTLGEIVVSSSSLSVYLESEEGSSIVRSSVSLSGSSLASEEEEEPHTLSDPSLPELSSCTTPERVRSVGRDLSPGLITYNASIASIIATPPPYPVTPTRPKRKFDQLDFKLLSPPPAPFRSFDRYSTSSDRVDAMEVFREKFRDHWDAMASSSDFEVINDAAGAEPTEDLHIAHAHFSQSPVLVPAKVATSNGTMAGDSSMPPAKKPRLSSSLSTLKSWGSAVIQRIAAFKDGR